MQDPHDVKTLCKNNMMLQKLLFFSLKANMALPYQALSLLYMTIFENVTS